MTATVAADTLGGMTSLAERPVADQLEDAVDPATLRAVASTFATGITVITCPGASGPQGCTANAVLSVSLDPPLMLVSLGESSRTRAAIEEAGSFAINVLPDSAAGEDLCTIFAGRDMDKFATVRHSPGRTGSPILSAALGWFDCEITSIQTAGDHALFLGRVVAASHREGDPMVFFRGGRRRLERS
jgi:flavin reductase (DIM6/NTAB) family NADH-FMN oxidoreductase RutF